MDILSIIYIILIWLVGLKIAHNTSRRIKNPIAYLVFFEHLSFSYFYYLFTQNGTADANGYFNRAIRNDFFLESFGVGTDFIDFIATIPIKYLHFSLPAAHQLFGLLGFIGFTYLLRMLNNKKFYFFGIPVIYIVVLLPGFHFWTCALGKDSLFFMALMMFFYSLMHIKGNVLKLIFGLIIISLIRPHIGLTMITAISLTLILRKPKSFSFAHFFLIIIVGIIFALSLPFVMEYVGIEEISSESIEKKIEIFNNEGARDSGITSNIDVSDYSLPMKMFSYLFRPLFYDAKSVFQLIASIENLFLLLIFGKLTKRVPFYFIKWFRQLSDIHKIMFFYVLLSWLLLSINMYNLGLASRQKFMIIPVIFLLFLSNIKRNQLKK